MFNILKARAASRIRNTTLTEEQRRERFIELVEAENGGESPGAWVDEMWFGGDGILSKPANMIRAKYNQK